MSDNFDLESPLYLCGYNVSQQNALKDEDRHRILSFVIDVGILTLKDVESYITTFINLRKNRATMDIAISKWKKDLGWLHSNYGNKYNVVKHKKYIK